MRRFLIALSGARPDVLARCKGETAKFEGVGGAVLTTAVIAVISMCFALVSALDVSVWLAVPTALVWGLMILSLDRWLVTTMRSDSPRRFALAVPRLLMAVLLGAVVSTPLVLQIFKSEIDAQIVEIKQQRAEEFAREQNQGTMGKSVDELRADVARLQQVISSGGDVPVDLSQDAKIKSLQADRATAEKQADKHYKEWQCQLYGGAGCTKKGDGPLAQSSKKAYDRSQARIADLNRQIETRKEELTAAGADAKESRLASAREALPKAQEQLDLAVQRQSDLQAVFDEENLVTDGLLIRLQALNEVTGKDTTLSTARIVLFLLFLLIECLPVTIKLMMRPGNYERVLALAEKDEYRKARSAFNEGGPQGEGGEPDPGGSWNVWGVWSRPSDTGDNWRSPGPRGPNGTTVEDRPEPVAGMRDDDALRRMNDTRAARLSSIDRPGGVELLPDDDH
ncbi:DUF4407 domain-containing protein [Herbidospora sp. NEAU-GS84]|uniref:DUF4407 domain-containing protein n=1 Tax=Herbidospora solisilvae TaxID=2696284 RepID=A0A7C9JDN5_9ACTN|nr:DUF4407 domain-containing protein [Herbidospora solisilvae]NAS23861.1 DUF4407 domain-containing protein [Herbidospora solisilvae]